MVVDIQYQTEPSGVVMKFSGHVTGRDLIEANNSIADFSEGEYQLTDFTGAENIDISLKDLHRVAIQDCSIPPYYKLKKLAIVGDTRKYARLVDLYFHFVEAWVGKCRKYETRTFRDIEKARQWLGIAQDRKYN